MSFSSRNGIHFFSFDSFPNQRVRHGIITRQGGVSPQPWASLNVGGTVGDSRERVLENRARSLQALDIDPGCVYDSWQVHGSRIQVVDRPLPAGQELAKADGLITSTERVALMMRFADCVPILLFDPDRSAIGLAHAGWRGTVKDVAGEIVREMVRKFGSEPERLIAGIGPSIGPDHYEVGEEVVEAVLASQGLDSTEVLVSRRGRTYFDLWRSNQLLLEAAGVRTAEVAGVCTACHVEDWFSHRAENGKTGRFAAIIQLGG